MSADGYGKFRVANEYLGEPAALDELYRQDGYLFLQGVIDRALVARVRSEFMHELARQGFIAPNEELPLWTGRDPDALDDAPLYALAAYVELCNAPSTRALFEQVLGGPAYVFRNTVLRFAFPDDIKHLTCAHQDGYFHERTPDFRTFWMPLMEVDETVGGLALAAGSHRGGILPHAYMNAVSATGYAGRRRRGVTDDQVSGTPLTAHYRPGDVVVFHRSTIHWALPNRSRLVRLSVDARAQPDDLPRSWEASHTVAEGRQYRQVVRAMAVAEGASDDQYEALVDRMLRGGDAIELARVRALLNDIRAGAGLTASSSLQTARST
jgi:ectoine hydroxylase-related dioxygenase (phytanoyl-CoA dioxygenase family)